MAVTSYQIDCSLTPELRNKVFLNELIQDKIFDFIFSPGINGTKQARKNVFACRRVEKAWLEFVSRRLRKSNFLSIRFLFTARTFQDFLNIWTKKPDAYSRIPLFNLHFPSWACMARGDIIELVRCLKQFGSNLNSLTIDMKQFTPFVTLIPISMNFPIDMRDMQLPKLVNLNVIMNIECCDFVIDLLLRPILASCENLLSLNMEMNERELAPFNRLFTQVGHLNGELEYLPITLEKLQINMNLAPELLANLLLENRLPNLTDLTICTWKKVYCDVISRILDCFSQQLKHLSLRGNFNNNPFFEEISSPLVLLKFPIMSKLKNMYVSSFHYEPEPGMAQPFPLLQSLNFHGQTTSMMINWTRHSHFESVKELKVKIAHEYNFANDDNHNFTLGLSQQLQASFPKVEKLDIDIGNLLENGSVRNVFEHMTTLSKLTFRLRNTGQFEETCTWDAILLGVDPQHVKNLDTTSADRPFNIARLNRVRPTSHSIVNLKCLTAFALKAADRTNDRTDNLISDISFWYAFLCMPNLQLLTLIGQFRASKEMAQEWRGQGRRILEDESGNDIYDVDEVNW